MPPTEPGQSNPMSDREVELATAVARLEGRVEASERATREAVDRLDARLQGEVQSILGNQRATDEEVSGLRSLLVGANGQNGLQSRVGKLEVAADISRHGPQVTAEVATALQALQTRCDALEAADERRTRWALALFAAGTALASGIVLTVVRLLSAP